VTLHDERDRSPPAAGGHHSALGLYGVMLAVFAMTALSGALDPLIGPLVRAVFGPISDTAVTDVRMVGVLLLFALSFVGMILGMLEKHRDRRLLMIGVAGVFSSGFAFMLKRMGEGGLDGKPLYIALTILLALALPVALVSARSGATRLVHVYATFAVALVIGLFGGAAMLGLCQLLWPATAFADVVGTRRFVITPMAVVMVGAGWGAMTLYPALVSPAVTTVHRAWTGVYVAVAFVLASGYGRLFFSPKRWVETAGLEPWVLGGVASALLLSSVMVTALLARREAGLHRGKEWFAAAVLVAIAHAAAAYWTTGLLAIGAHAEFPFVVDRDRWPFVLSHAAAGAASVPLLMAIRWVMGGYPWPHWHWVGKILK